jgi:uncharacterized protein (TIGR00369 family)
MTTDLEAVRGFYRASPFMVDLGIEPTQVGEGRVHSELQLQPRHHQHTGQVHAGVTNAMADQTMGAAAQTLAPEGRWALTAELKTSHLRAAKGERLQCEAWVVRGGRTLSFTEAEVYAVSGARRTLVVKASATMALVESRP